MRSDIMRFILCTIGTSLLTNREDDRPWEGWKRDKLLPDAAVIHEWLSNADPVFATAETHTLGKLDLSEHDRLALLHSDTPEGRLCADALRGFYAGKVREVSLHQLDSLGYGAEVFNGGLRALVNKTIQLVVEARSLSLTPLFCATGGFKAEIAFMNLMGALLGIEVYYIHDQHLSLVRLPSLPIEWDTDIVGSNANFFQWIDEEPRKSAEVESWLNARSDLRPLVEDGEDGNTYLSPAGDLLYKVARDRQLVGPPARWPISDINPPERKDGLSAVEHDRPPGWDRFVDRLCRIDCVKRVNYDQAFRHGDKVRTVMEEEKRDGKNLWSIGVRYEAGSGNPLPMRVATTANDELQVDLVASYIRRLK